MSADQFDLDKTLLTFSTGDKTTEFSIRDSVNGIQCFGGIGSGKTSGPGRLIALTMLKNNFGGLVLTVKSNEAKLWKKYCEEAGRSDDLIVVSPNSDYAFNFMQYESSLKDKTYTQNLVNILSTVIKAGKEQENKGSTDEFWQDALMLTITNAIDLCLLAYGYVTIQLIFDIFLAAPKKETEKSPDGTPLATAYTIAYNLARKKIRAKMVAWEDGLDKEVREAYVANDQLEEEREKAIPEYRQLGSVYTFFIERYKTLSEKTRSIVDFSFMGFLTRLLQEPVYSLLCSKPSTVVPEDSLKGKIIVVDLPVKLYDKVGRDSQILFKFCWQRAMERRDIEENGRPVFCWCDESQYLLHPGDALFQTTAREIRVATVYLTQNISNYHATMGGDKSEHYVNSFLGTMANKIFCANSDIATNQYSSSLIGEAYFEEASRTTTTTAGVVSTANSITHRLEKIIRPEAFVRLLTGGPKNKGKIECYIHRQGNPFHNDVNHQKLTIIQKQ